MGAEQVHWERRKITVSSRPRAEGWRWGQARTKKTHLAQSQPAQGRLRGAVMDSMDDGQAPSARETWAPRWAWRGAMGQRPH